jgi:uncharacterized protein (DUF1800 family)
MRLTFLRLAIVIVPGLVALGAAPAAAPSLGHAEAVHVLNRLTFGATTRSVTQLRAVGLTAWLRAQLHPGEVPDPSLDARLAAMTTLSLSPRELAEQFYLPALERRRAARAAAGHQQDVPDGATPAGPEMARRRGAGAGQMTPERIVLLELTTQKLVRMTTAERQLEEVLVDFWFNHFNVFAGKGPVRQYVADFERSAIRPHVFGSFRDMLGAVAAHPAMLFYLDNWQSSAPGSRTMRGASGLNENYARELLELHTLGVDGGYTQQDIVDVARAFTGWSIRMPRAGGDGFYDRRRHDDGKKVVLGHQFPAGRQRDEGERVLDIVAAHPATARHLARKLARRLVSDRPSEALVTRVAARFTATRGDLRATVEALITSPEFLAADTRWAKVKTPLDYVASALRVLDVNVEQAGALGQQLRTLGMPPYFAAPPTGYGDRAEDWTNAGALVQRMNLAVALTHGRVRGVSRPAFPDPAAAANAATLARMLALRDLSPSTLKTVAQARTAPEMAALVLGSPEFQRR